jgi:hypothetical protein
MLQEYFTGNKLHLNGIFISVGDEEKKIHPVINVGHL